MGPEVSEAELGELIGEVLERLARDPAAAHLWQWRARPGCADEPYGRSRRDHIGALLGLLGAAAAPALAAGCTPAGEAKPPETGGPSSPGADGGAEPPPVCADDPCDCADDPCACADDPCAM